MWVTARDAHMADSALVHGGLAPLGVAHQPVAAEIVGWFDLKDLYKNDDEFWIRKEIFNKSHLYIHELYIFEVVRHYFATIVYKVTESWL